MKIRSGFVSNSSSSSFICDVCGNDASGFDIGLDDAEMSECRRGHIICDRHLVEEIKDRYSFCSSLCPCCQLESPTDDIIIKYLLHKYGKTLDEVKKEMKDLFGTAGNLYEALK